MTNTDTHKSGFVVLSIAEYDLGVFPTHTAFATARDYSTNNGVVVTVRDAVTDEVIETIVPKKEDRFEVARAFARMRRQALNK